MARGARITPEERSKAVALLVDGHSCNETAAIIGRPHQTVSRIGSSAGVDSASAAMERMRRDLPIFDAARRLEHTNKMAAVVERYWDAYLEPRVTEDGTLIEPPLPDARDMRDAAVASGIAIDKRRLEEGLSTSNISQRYRAVAARELPGLSVEAPEVTT